MKTNINKFIKLSPKCYTEATYVLHGTTLLNAKEILKSTFNTFSGHATVTLNPNVAYSLYAKKDMKVDQNMPIKDGAIIILNTNDYSLSSAFLSSVSVDNSNKIVDGRISEWMKGNLAFYEDTRLFYKEDKKLLIPSINIECVLLVNISLDNVFINVLDNLYSETIDFSYINTQIETLLFEPSNIYYCRDKTALKELAIEISNCFIVSVVVERLRKLFISNLYVSGYTLKYSGYLIESDKKVSDTKTELIFNTPYGKTSKLTIYHSYDRIKKELNILSSLVENINDKSISRMLDILRKIIEDN